MKKKNTPKTGKKSQLFNAYYFWYFFAFIILFCIVNTFSGLTKAPIFDWDEARHGISAYEMLKNNDYVVHTYLGEVDYWNLKPPLSFWSIAFSYKLFGVNVFAFRFFSSASLVVIVSTFMLFFRKYFHPFVALVGGLLFSFIGVQMNHLFLHGDADALFYLFCYLSLLFFCKSYLSSNKYLVGSGICIAFAFLSKATHIVIVGMIIVVSSFLLRNVKKILIKHWLVYWIVPMFVPIMIWMLVRYLYDGMDFFREMLFVDILARASTGLEGNSRDVFYYIQELSRALGSILFSVCILSVLISIYLLINKRVNLNNNDRVIAVVGISTSLIPVIFYSAVTTKLSWYVWPATIGFIFLITWIFYFTYKNHLLAKTKRKEPVFWLSIITFYSVIIGIGLLAMPNHKDMQYYYDTSTMFPEVSIFYEIPKSENATYCVVDASGNTTNFSQSWILHGIFTGYEYHTGNLNDYYTNNSLDYIFVKFDSTEEIEIFRDNHPTLNQFYEADSIIIYSK